MAKVAPPKKKKTKGGKLRMVSGLPKETIDFRLSEEEQICPECGEKLTEVRKTIRRELIVIPAQVKVKEYIDAVYACRNCQKNGIENPMHTGRAPRPLLENSLVSASFASYIMKKKFVDELHYLTEEEMLDMTALAQTAPGAIAVNGAILVGRRIAGIPGLIVAVLATILPPIVIISIISMMYAAFAENEWVRAVLTGMQSGVAAVICDVTANLGGKVVQSKDWLNLLLMAGAFAASAVFHVNVIVVILVAAAIGVIRALLARKGGVSA